MFLVKPGKVYVVVLYSMENVKKIKELSEMRFVWQHCRVGHERKYDLRRRHGENF